MCRNISVTRDSSESTQPTRLTEVHIGGRIQFSAPSNHKFPEVLYGTQRHSSFQVVWISWDSNLVINSRKI